MAASRNASTANTNNAASTAPLRISFAKIKEPLEVPNLLALQTESFDWLLGNDAWKARVESALESGQDVPTKSGLEEIFEEISPIEDFSGSMSLTFRDHRFEPPKNSIDKTIISVQPWVMIVREIVLVIAWSMTWVTDSLRSLRKVSRIRSKITTDSLTE